MSGTAIRLRQFVDTSPQMPPGYILHQGKDVTGFYPGQTARVHYEYPPENERRYEIKMQTVPVKHETVLQHGYDYLVLKQYIHYQRTKKKVSDWSTTTTYRESFTLPFYKSDIAEDYHPKTDAESQSVWKSFSAKKKDKTKPSFMGV
ncbi:protein SPMIP3 [Zootoca vivipara]|uniref:protein SPMIP3 n=1 Tax=Zootoca vivipara TaxID=8524 RepID=UPI001591E2E5|nr:protein SPMIP3 [Zootoca vivipara]